MNYLEQINHSRYKVRRTDLVPRLMGANNLIGNEVYSKDDENVGNINEIMLNMYTGEINYAVLSYGVEEGTKLFAVPWEALTLDTKNKRFVLDVDSDTLKDAPGFDKDDWPDTADDIWMTERISNALWY